MWPQKKVPPHDLRGKSSQKAGAPKIEGIKAIKNIIIPLVEVFERRLYETMLNRSSSKHLKKIHGEEVAKKAPQVIVE